MFLLLPALWAPEMVAARYWIGPTNSTSYTTNPCNTSTDQPLLFDQATVQNIIANNPCAPNDLTVHLTFKAGVYDLDTLYLNSGPNRILILEGENPSNLPVFRFKAPANQNGFFLGPARETWLLHSPVGSKLARFEAHHLILDGNWPAWAAANTYASPANPNGFKLGALRVRADTGWIRRVRVINCGAKGKTPWQWWDTTGVECFPLYVEAAQYQANA